MYTSRLRHIFKPTLAFVRACSSESTYTGPKVTPILTKGERSVNQVTLIGRVGSGAEMRGTEEQPVALFSLATSQSFRRRDGTMYQNTQWHRISVFRPSFRDNIAANLEAGDKVYVSGILQYGQYLDKKTNEVIKVANIIAEDLILLAKSKKSAQMPPEDLE